MDKKGQEAMADGTIFIIRIILVAIIAFFVLGVSNMLYAVYIDVRNVEATIMSRGVVDCLSPSGVLNLDSLTEQDYTHLLDYCNISQSERFYVEVKVINESNSSVALIRQGESGQIWALRILSSKYSDSLKKYIPGYSYFAYPTYFIKEGVKNKGIVKMEVLVNDEF